MATESRVAASSDITEAIARAHAEATRWAVQFVAPSGKHAIYGPFDDEESATEWGARNVDDGKFTTPTMYDVNLYDELLDGFQAAEAERARYRRAMEGVAA